jgi:hypothetical protein
MNNFKIFSYHITGKIEEKNGTSQDKKVFIKRFEPEPSEYIANEVNSIGRNSVQSVHFLTKQAIRFDGLLYE